MPTDQVYRCLYHKNFLSFLIDCMASEFIPHCSNCPFTQRKFLAFVFSNSHCSVKGRRIPPHCCFGLLQLFYGYAPNFCSDFFKIRSSESLCCQLQQPASHHRSRLPDFGCLVDSDRMLKFLQELHAFSEAL